MNIDLKKLRSDIRRHGLVAAYVVLGICIAIVFAVCAGWLLDVAIVKNVGDRNATSTAAYTLRESEPIRLRIPKLDIDVPFVEPLGLTASREVEVPKGYQEVGWYKYGPTPGELGPAVVFGHVDSLDGPAVFFYLGQLAPGDEVMIEREDGTVATFEVTALERYDQDEFPTDLVYGDIDHAGLRLITCSGTFDKATQRYSRNLVVYAALKARSEITDTSTMTP